MAGKLAKIVSEAQWNALLERIYDAAIDTTLWGDVLLELGKPVQAHVAQLANVGRSGTDTFEDIVVGETEPNAAPEFEELVSRGEQLRVNHATTIGEFEPMYDYQHTSESEMRHSLFYQEHAVPLNVPYYAGIVLRKGRTTLTAVVHFRPESAGHFSPEEIAYLMRLAPHVYRSLELSQQVRTRATIQSAESLLEVLGCAGIVVDDRLRIVATNDKADRLLSMRDGVSKVGRRLGLADSRARRTVDSELASYFRRDPLSAALTAPSIRATRPSGRRPYQILTYPLKRDFEPFLRRFAIVLVLDPETNEKISVDRFADETGLTPAETRVASLLASGYSISEIARQRQSQPDTVRNQVKQILSKTGCRRQAELVALLWEFASVPIGSPIES